MTPDQLPRQYRYLINRLAHALERASKETGWTHFQFVDGTVISYGACNSPLNLVQRETR